MSTVACHFKWHVCIARVNSSITVSFYFSMYILNLVLNSWLFCWCSCREVNTVNSTEQDDPIFHQSNHVTYQLTQWPHSINTNIKEKHQYHTQYHMVYYWSTTAYKTSHCRLFSQRAESHVSAYVSIAAN